MAERKPRTYGEAVEAAQKLLAQGRLADPGEHYPYKHADVTALLEENPPAGPDGPDDDRVCVRDLMSQAIADASRDYIDAQATYVADPSEENRAAYDVARDVLIEARRRHRANRTAGPTVTAIRGAE
jgi:hypothetical protein